MRPMETPEELRLTLGGWTTRALIWPGSSECTVLCLHGWGDSAEAFKPMAEAWPERSATMVALDFPGCGVADPLHEGAQLPQFVDFAAAALEHFGALGTVIGVGQSLGGRALLTAAARNPHTCLLGVLAVAPAPLKLPPWQQVLVRNRHLMPSVSHLATDESDQQLVNDLVESHRRTCFHDAQRVPDRVFDDYRQYVSPARARNHIEALRQFGLEIQQSLQLDDVRCPVHLVWGENDRIAPISGAQAYLEALPQAWLTKLPACGHHAHIEMPEQVAEQVRLAVAHWCR